MGLEELAEAVERACVAQGQLVRLALEAHLDCVEGVLDVFAQHAGELGRVNLLPGAKCRG